MVGSASDAQLLGGLPDGIRGELLSAFAEIATNYRQARWGPSQLNAGKFCEVVISVLSGHVRRAIPDRATKPQNLVDACRALEKAPADFPRSVRIQIPRMLVALYEFRNNRGVGHVGGDVDANHMDAVCVLHMAKWVMAELVRIFHNVNINEAQAAVENLLVREMPIVWEVAGTRRVLDRSLSMKEQMLLLLYSSGAPVSDADLVKSLEYSNPTVFRREVLGRAHGERLIEYEAASGLVHLSPAGSAYVETKLPLTFTA